jgi:uncharacterized peroxidase-related enzyme
VATIKLIPKEEATGKLQEIYQEIMETLGIDFVPNMYQAMGHKPSYLEANWNRTKTIMQEPGKLDKLTKEIIAVAVSAVGGCDYCISVHTAAVRRLGLDDEAIFELMAVVDLFIGLNHFNVGMQVEPDEKPWHG